jgi:CofD-related protein of GAK system
MAYINTKYGPVVRVQLNHPTSLPVYKKVHNYEHHPKEGPPIALLSGGSGARALAETLVRFTHNSSHVLPMFDDGGSSRELRRKLGMPPPGDLRNRLMALSDMSMSGNPEVSRLFRTRLPKQGSPAALREQLEAFLDGEHEQMARIERRYRRIIVNHLMRFCRRMPDDFDLRGGNIGNFVISGAYLSLGDLESVIFEFSALAAVRGEVFPICSGGDYHLKAEFADGSSMVGQSRITSTEHPPIRRLSIVARREGLGEDADAVDDDDDDFVEVQPTINNLAAGAIRRSALVAYAMGSFYTSIVPNLLVAGTGQAIRETKRPKVFVANLLRDRETQQMTVAEMLQELRRYLMISDPCPGKMEDYVHYVLVNDHGTSRRGEQVPVDLEAICALGVEPIVLPLATDPDAPGVHDPERVAAVLLSLC